MRVTTPPVEGTFFHLAAKFGAKPAEAAQLLRAASRAAARSASPSMSARNAWFPAPTREALRIVGETMGGGPDAAAVSSMSAAASPPPMSAAIPPLEDFMTAIEAGVKD